MMAFAKTATAAIVLCALISPLTSLAATNLEVSTFNTRWFGLSVQDPRSGNMKPVPPAVLEERARIMKDFIEKNIQNKDVISFQEVVDVASLEALLPKGWHCASYKMQNLYHQRVALCASGKYQLLNPPYDTDNSIEEVATDSDWSRPALRMDLADLNGKRIVRIVGVHFKSAPTFSKERQRQASVIAEDLAKDPTVPAILLGDLNTYSAKQTGEDKDDVEKIVSALQKTDKSFQGIPHNVRYTYRSYKYASLFDHVLVNRGIKAKAAPNVYAVCNNSQEGQGYLDFKYYYKFVSDHCPVSVSLTVP